MKEIEHLFCVWWENHEKEKQKGNRSNIWKDKGEELYQSEERKKPPIQDTQQILEDKIILNPIHLDAS